jgi:hypothetical protein
MAGQGHSARRLVVWYLVALRDAGAAFIEHALSSPNSEPLARSLRKRVRFGPADLHQTGGD